MNGGWGLGLSADAVAEVEAWGLAWGLGPEQFGNGATYTRTMKQFWCLVFVMALAVSGCGGGNDGGGGGGISNLIPTSPTSNVPFSTTDLRVGTGAEATVGRGAAVRYTGWLYSPTSPDNKGTQFDANQFSFTVGQGVVPGFSMGVNGMRVGGLRRVVIPPNLGYGNSPPPNSPIRANETLLFEIELVAVQ